MPLEIRELHIKAIVESSSETGATSSEAKNNENSEERIIQVCIERVMELLKEEKER